MHTACYGRLGNDPKSISTKTGKSMAVGTVAVELQDRQNEAHTIWVGVVCFGRTAEALLKHGRGDLVSICGRTQYNAYTNGKGEAVEQLQVIADSVVSARTVRPGGKRRSSNDTHTSAGDVAHGDGDLGEEQSF